MKTRILFLGAATVLLSASLTAQVPNGGFEDWATPAGATYQDPVGWITLNGVTSNFGVYSCEQGTAGAPEGSYYAQVTSVSALGTVVPGVIITGNGDTQAPGFAYTGRPDALNGQWQYGIMPQDTGAVVVQFTKWNTSTQSQDVIGAGGVQFEGDQNSWQAFSVPISYASSETPDSASVAIVSGLADSPVEGSFIKVDALSFGVPTGIAQVDQVPSLRIYPSPATDVVHVKADSPIGDVNVMDITGRTVLRKSLGTEQAVINVQALHTGRYLMQVQMADGKRQVRSFVKR